MEICIMSNLIYNIFICSVFVLTPVFGQNTFKSPDNAWTILCSVTDKVGADWSGKNIDKLISISLLKDNNTLLWNGVSYQDETGFPPHVIWANNSKEALFLYRPQRGEVIIGIFRPNSTVKYESVLSNVDLNSWTTSVQGDQVHFKKIWTEKWIEIADNIYEGDLFIAVSTIRKFRIRVVTSNIPSAVTVLKQE